MRFALLLLLAPLAFPQAIPGRYIVELTGDSATRRAGRQGGRPAARRAAVRAEQEGVRQRLGSDVQVLASADTVSNSLFVAVDDARAAALASVPGVRRVYQDRLRKRLLDRAVVVNKITEAWDRVGDDKAGEGVKIAIIDTGVDITHEALRDGGLALPDSYPRTNAPADEAYTNHKVIVARSYVSLLSRRDPDNSARDHMGHGTALAVVAAGMRSAGPLATIQGVAPRAYIGSYKVFGSPGVNEGATDAAIMKAIDDAVADGMDIINLSLGSDIAPPLDADPLVAAVEQATQAGVLVVTAAGNNGPDFGTISSPGTAPSAIAVGATRNDRTFGSSIEIEGIGVVLAVRGSGIPPQSAVSGTIVDVARLDDNGLACGTLPPGSLNGHVALILRGTCTFESKLNNAQRAGAIAAIVYAAADSPEAITMSVGAASLPAEMVSHATGLLLKERGNGTGVSLRFTISAVPQEHDRTTTFSAIGPNLNLAIKPELVAVGGDFYVATQTLDPNGDMYSANGYILVDGTSFSAPLVAGALALLKSARPGLTTGQYRSLLINSATAVTDPAGNRAAVQKAGAGQLDLGGSLGAQVAAVPAVLSLGTAQNATATLRLENLAAASDIYAISVEPAAGGAAPIPSEAFLTVEPGTPGALTFSMNGAGLSPGAYEGFVTLTGTSGATVRVPYWYAVPDSRPATIPLLEQTASGRRGTLLREAFYFRVTDGAGIPLTQIQPEITAIEGGGSINGVFSLDSDSPGLFGATVRLGPAAGTNTFRIQAGDAVLDVHITGQ